MTLTNSGMADNESLWSIHRKPELALAPHPGQIWPVNVSPSSTVLIPHVL